MRQPPARPLAAIDADLRACRIVRSGAQEELANVRRRMAELVELEATLLVTIETRCGQADRLLDERLRAVADGAERAERDVPDELRRLAGV